MEKKTESARIGDRLRRLREERGHPISIAVEISNKYGLRLSPRGLSRMERGLREIPLVTLYALAEFYGANPGEIADPHYRADSRELDFLKKDSELLADLDKLGRKLGPASARERIKDKLRHLMDIVKRRKEPKR